MFLSNYKVLLENGNVLYTIGKGKEREVVKEDRALLNAKKRKLEGRQNEVYIGAHHSTAVFTTNQQNCYQN